MNMYALPSIKGEAKYKDLLIDIDSREDIPKEWHQTPIEAFIMSQNFGFPIQTTGKPELLVVTCIDFRYSPTVPRTYAYVVRRPNGRVLGSEFSAAYALAKGVKHFVMIGHNDCGMSKVSDIAPHVIDALVDQGWRRELAEAYVKRQGPHHAIADELGALEEEYLRLLQIFPKATVAPLFVSLHDSKLYLPSWYQEIQLRKPEQKPKPSVPDELIKGLP